MLRPPPETPMRVSAPPPPRSIVTSSPRLMALAVSARVRAGTTTPAVKPGSAGDHVSSRAAMRYRSVQASHIVSPSMSMRTPVSIGRVSSRPAAGVTWATAVANRSLGTVPAWAGGSGRVG